MAKPSPTDETKAEQYYSPDEPTHLSQPVIEPTSQHDPEHISELKDSPQQKLARGHGKTERALQLADNERGAPTEMPCGRVSDPDLEFEGVGGFGDPIVIQGIRFFFIYMSMIAMLFCVAILRTPNKHDRKERPLTQNPTFDLRKREVPTCATGGITLVDSSPYNTRLHVGALFAILVVSTAACSFPLLASRFSRMRLSSGFFFGVRHFGTGVLLATAFVHLLPNAFILLGEPCLGDFWTTKYNAMPGAIALGAMLFVIVIEMVFHPARRIRPVTGVGKSPVVQTGSDDAEATAVSVEFSGRLVGQVPHVGCRGEREGQDLADGKQIVTRATPGCQCTDDEEARIGRGVAPLAMTREQKQRKELLQCILLEVGILFHSVFIGMTLSVSLGNEFVVLLVAIGFHQTFEGLALGSRIAAIDWPRENSWQPWVMASAYGCTTPVGQALGIATHTLYSPESKTGLILVGTMSAISAGLLTFASLVELLSEDLLSDKSWQTLRGKSRVYACLLVFLGSLSMSLVGAWA
ncbi:ZIP zinc transporter-domain-containing protein [Cercophora scortea]|uniref:ZIP zinc transporter-domain-containing protein n=1 Tax=Cercophora scortea TaxID=314031 RepID=A0AAE0IDK4_9PEZI|nr:ZIP zinc transporter-domain-containing protein [Cercophora scortea]